MAMKSTYSVHLEDTKEDLPKFCQADECECNLSNAKLYYQRHKVCEEHAKAPDVLVKNLSQRFCQQCSKFHEVANFDDSKRSCRSRLANHNQRRRKPLISPLDPEVKDNVRIREYVAKKHLNHKNLKAKNINIQMRPSRRANLNATWFNLINGPNYLGEMGLAPAPAPPSFQAYSNFMDMVLGYQPRSFSS
ncbi:hypothetical protein Patl1_29236 [Pistacia atlantica]|uniref:Uncharacterized protein n=1 Tax=Pistacia atlantica TaxID=434234 RepID=A0ACC1BCF4_9ROSI|nr:hypothetical protein Patl1_29236 [Pistacia atlantica]